MVTLHCKNEVKSYDFELFKPVNNNEVKRFQANTENFGPCSVHEPPSRGSSDELNTVNYEMESRAPCPLETARLINSLPLH